MVQVGVPKVVYKEVRVHGDAVQLRAQGGHGGLIPTQALLGVGEKSGTKSIY